MSDQKPTCPICGSSTEYMGSQQGRLIRREFRFFHCDNCQFRFVANPSSDYANLYDQKYYEGLGADPMIDYAFEMRYPNETVRIYEWRGVVKMVNSLKKLDANTKWLEFGCGNGGVVRHARENTPCQVMGFEEGWIAGEARKIGIPILTRDELAGHAGTFDVITALEVIEHVSDPIECLKFVRKLLKPGGVLLMTTDNAEPHRNNFFKWSYVVPEIHVSYFEPQCLAKALEKTGFRAEFKAPLPGYSEVIRARILKNLGVRRRSIFEKIQPWPLLVPLADMKYKGGAHPIGWAV